MGRNKGVRVILFFNEQLLDAAKVKMKSTGENLSELIRRVVAQDVGSPELGIPPPTGRPRKDAAPEQQVDTATKKVARAASGKKVMAAKKAAKKGSP